MKKRILSMLLTIVLVVGLLPMSVFAAEPAVVKSYSVATLYSDGTLEIFADVSNLANIPWQNERASIIKVVFTVDTPLYTRLFSDCTNLAEITLPSTVTEIPSYCFNSCPSLTSITIPDSVTSIGERAFSGCSVLGSVIFGENSNLQSIGNNAFNQCDALTSITIPDSVTSIGNWSFNSCDTLASIVIPDSVTSIGDRAFSECKKLSSIALGVNSKLQTIGIYAFNNCDVLTSIAIPDTVTSIGNFAFNSCDALASVVIPDSVTSISNGAFSSCKALASIAIPDSVTSIGESAFYNCDSLASITIPNLVASIGERAFYGCDVLTDIHYEGTVESWNSITKGDGAIPNGVKINHTGDCVDNDTNHTCDLCGKDLTHAYLNEWKFDGNSHWHECSCGAKADSAVHSGGTATCTEKAECSVCDTEYGEKDPDAHNWDVWILYDANNHYRGCHRESCDEKEITPHSGGTATCTAKAVCETCTQPYGNLAQHRAAAAWSKNDTHHWRLCVYWTEGGICQERFDYAEHADADNNGACDACGYTMTVTPPPHTHSLGWKYNDNSHWQECADPSCPNLEDSRTAAENHSGGAATCTEKATCSVCSQPYGELAAHSFSTDWTYDSNTHWHAATCGHEVVSDTAEHSYGSDRTCDTCGYTKPAPYTPPSAPTWRPDVDCGENGDVTVTPRYPEKGDTVIITPEPDKGYEVDEIIVTDRNGESVTVTDKGDGTYRFKQPYGKVTITVTFRKEVCSGGADCPISSFTDLDSDAWYHEAIDFVMDNDMMSGYPGNLFGPNDSITRGQIVTILHRLEGAPVVNYLMTYEDVDQEKYYAEAIRWATSEGIVAGYGNGSFGPDDPITRQQLATILWRYSQHKGYDVSVGEDTNILSYEDAFDISGYAIPAMQWACGAGVMGGYGNGYLGPNDGATHAQAAQMLKNFMEKAAK